MAAAIADIVQLQQPPPLRWPVGEDCVRMLRDRGRLTDEDWERVMRSQGWGFAAGDVVDATGAPVGERGWLSPPPPDPLFAEPRLARIYDVLEADRADLDAYVALADELGARRCSTSGCGTGTFACRLRLLDSTSSASIRPPRRSTSPGPSRVPTMSTGCSATPAPCRSLQVDLATMTGNVAMVFTADDDWAATLEAIRTSCGPVGRFVFETRVPERQAWLEWTPTDTFERVDVPGVGPVANWVEVLDVRLPFVTFRQSYEFESDGARADVGLHAAVP